MAVEGEQTWNGIPMDIKPGNGKLAKKSGAALITFRIEGSYLLRPRWAKNLRRGRVHGKVVNVYTPEMLADMSAEEVDEAIARDLYFDIWKWQKEQNTANRYIPVKGGLAEGLEKALGSCPAWRKENCSRMKRRHLYTEWIRTIMINDSQTGGSRLKKSGRCIPARNRDERIQDGRAVQYEHGAGEQTSVQHRTRTITR